MPRGGAVSDTLLCYSEADWKPHWSEVITVSRALYRMVGGGNGRGNG